MLVEREGVEAIIGMHTSDIREAVMATIGGIVPYVYAPMHEGGEPTPGVYMVGETPETQFAPMIDWMMRNLGSQRWFLIGNKYRYPYLSNRYAKDHIVSLGAAVVGERYFGLEIDSFGTCFSEIAGSKADAVLVNLIGGSAVAFNRAYRRTGLADTVPRYCCVLEENMALAAGTDNGAAGIYTATGYMETLTTPAANRFRSRYKDAFGSVSPVLNQFAVSCYDGMHLLAHLAKTAGSLKVSRIQSMDDRRRCVESPRGELLMERNQVAGLVTLTRCNGVHLESIGAR